MRVIKMFERLQKRINECFSTKFPFTGGLMDA